MPFPMDNFRRQFVKEHVPELSPEDQQEVLQTIPPEQRLAGLTPKQIREYLEQLTADPPAPARRPRRRK